MNAQRPTWNDLITIEPRLEELRLEALSIPRNDQRTCKNRFYQLGTPDNKHASFKRRLNALVGRHAIHPTLNSSSAFDVASDEILNSMPKCMYCGCYGPHGNLWWLALTEPLPGTEFPDAYYEDLPEDAFPPATYEPNWAAIDASFIQL